MALANDAGQAFDAFAARNYQQAHMLFSELVERDEDNADYLFHLAVSQLRTGETNAAEDSLERLFEVQPDHAEGYYLGGILNMIKLGQVSIFRKVGVAKAALESWEQVVKLEPNNDMGHYAVFSYLMQAPGIAGGSEKRAVEVLETLRSLESPYAHMAKAELEKRAGNLDAAEAALQQATTEITDRGGPIFALAQFYFEQENYEQALTALTRYEKSNKVWHDPDTAATYLYRGEILAEMGRVDEARSSYQTALASHPSSRTRERVQEALESL